MIVISSRPIAMLIKTNSDVPVQMVQFELHTQTNIQTAACHLSLV